MSDHKKFASKNDEYAALLGLFSSPVVNIENNEDTNCFSVVIKAPQGIDSADDLDRDVFVVSSMKVSSIFLPKELRDDSSGETHEGEQEVLIAYKVDGVKFEALYNSYDKLSGLKCEITENTFKDNIRNLVYAGVYLTTRATEQQFPDRDTKEVVTEIFDQHLPIFERFSDMNEMFGLYIRARLRGEFDIKGGKYTYFLPNDKLSEVTQDIPKNDTGHDFLLNSNNTYASKTLMTKVFTKLPKNTPEDLYKALDVNSINYHSRGRFARNIKAAIAEEKKIYDGSKAQG
ncbi:hypothetical protein IBE48_07785 [Francisella philomiragia]|uniref:Uncharacterized protein n=1 Tax=Francisella philomiragia TaxID=28110 RepID=A0AAW3DB18_9GAMM|nr:hypothetical protein [Francisella philomiragia]KFJ42706.1 hypothetical protein DR78_587 [Francisella philomiragia]MBK2255338.1 hypothetical protein [Francisella philomiragia]MBK2273651.1 hypothetical protein [Francisella philomiragia]MBK2277532.1 hypothetical protein [Francisella philomiragia]MBK2281472.1 hypothetical protein [Francisella philomiragia]